MAIDSIITNNSLPQQGVDANKNVLGKDDFLKLMIMQMQHQDPLNPMDNEQMLSQMAQFSSLEQMTNLNSTMAEANDNTSFMNATRLLGRKIHVINPVVEEGGSPTISSTVKSISHTAKGPVLTLANGFVTGLDEVVSIEESTQ